MAKKVLTLIKLQIPAGRANPAPPVGPALGQHGVNIMEFCKAFNAQTQQDAGTIIPVEITVFEDRSFEFITKTPPGGRPDQGGDRASRRAPASRTANKVGTISAAQVRQIAERKMPDLNANDLDAASDHRRHRPLDGRRRGGPGVMAGRRGKRFREALRQGRPRPPLLAGRGRRPGQGDGRHEVRRDGRGPPAPRGQRPPCRGAAPRHAGPAARARQGGCRRGVRRRATPPRPRPRRVPTTSARRTSPIVSTRAGPTSTSRSRPPI